MKYVVLRKAKRIKTLGVDFDGTLVKINESSPMDTQLLPGVSEAMEKFKSDGWTIIIYTCRPEIDWQEIGKFLSKNNIPFDYINENPLQRQLTKTKLYLDVLLDDKVVEFKGWNTAYDDVITRRKKIDRLRTKDKRVLR